MSKTYNLTAPDGHRFPAYTTIPNGKPKGGVVVLHEAFGVTEHIKEMAEWCAANGYAAVAPHLFARMQDVEEDALVLDTSAAGLEEGRRRIMGIPLEAVLTDIQTCINHLAPLPTATLGYCWGGSMSYLSGFKLTGLSACVGYYGGRMTELAAMGQPKIPTELHLAEHDRYIPFAEAQASIRKNHPEAIVYTYDADHGFNRTGGKTYNESMAKLARSRTLSFLDQHLAT